MLAGFTEAVVDDDLAEWGLRAVRRIEIGRDRCEAAGWNVFAHGSPSGESTAQLTARADRVVAKLRAVDGDVLAFTSGHIGRCIAARWIGQPITLGTNLLLSTASVSILSYDHGLDEPAILQWNETGRD